MKLLSKGKASKEKPSESNTQNSRANKRIKHAHTWIPFELRNRWKKEDNAEGWGKWKTTTIEWNESKWWNWWESIGAAGWWGSWFR